MKGIYIHIPFCEHKCKYCDFLSFPGNQQRNKERYVHALMREMEKRIDENWRKSDTIFIGGGTPSALDEEALEALLRALNRLVDMENVCEFTVECNPGTVNEEKLVLLKEGGVNRLSFGVQSFDDVLLKRIGRIHTAEQAKEAVRLAQKVGFTNINIDLMYGLPGQNEETWKKSVEEALALGVSHLSLYQLIIEEGTAIARELNRGVLPAVDEDGAAEWFDAQRVWLKEKGYAQYEISNYATSDKESKHNTLYWELDDYLGLGLGATSWERPERRNNTMDLASYVRALEAGEDAPHESEILTRDEQMAETVFMALRMNRGLSLEKFRTLYGEKLEVAYPEATKEAISKGWARILDGCFLLTDDGRRLGNFVFELFL